MQTQRRFAFSFAVILLTCFGVFVLPFLLPPAIIDGVSVANAAGFNNKVAAIAAAVVSLLVLLKEFRWPSGGGRKAQGEEGDLPWFAVFATAALCGALIAIFSRVIVLSHDRYINDAGYFLEQIGSRADYGRKLYDEIEFPYGPLLFYIPVLLRMLFAGFHLSVAGAYFTTLVLEHVCGLLMVGYILRSLPMHRVWKRTALILCAVVAIELSFGLNYTFFRFAAAPAFLIFTARQSKLWATSMCLFLGQVVALSVSPEMGFAFAAAGTTYAAIRFLREGKVWLVAVAIPTVATAVFLLAAGGAYLRMLKLFARGLYNLIVEPLPHVFIYLFALIWLVPLMLASSFRERRPEAPMLGSLYVFVLALLPVAFGRADPGHALFNGFILFFLSLIGMSAWRLSRQLLWVTCVSFTFLWAAYIDTRPYEGPFRSAIHYDMHHYEPHGIQQTGFHVLKLISPAAAEHYFSAVHDADPPFEVKKLQAVVGSAKVATPYLVPLAVEESLKQSGQYAPSFYCFHIDVLDALSEARKIAEMNRFAWAVIPKERHRISETPALTAYALGFALPYRMKHAPYVVGECFDQNLKTNWQPAAELGKYQIYRRSDLPSPVSCVSNGSWPHG